MNKKSRLRAKSPSDLLALGPYILGFEPTESVVLVALHQGESVGAARLDLRDIEVAPALAIQVWGQLSRPTPDAHVVVMGYGSDASRVARVLRTTAECIESAVGALVVDHVCLTDGRHWWSLTEEWDLDPEAGEPYDPTPPAVVDAITHGLAVAGDRRELEKSLEGPSRRDARPFASALRGCKREFAELSDDEGRTMVLELLMRALDAPAELSDTDQAALVVLMQRIPLRDEAWLTQTRASSEQHQVLWHHLVRRTPKEWAVPLVCLLGFSAWLSGHGALANIACQRALDLDPHYGMAGLLDSILMHGAHPDLWHQMCDIGEGVDDGAS